MVARSAEELVDAPLYVKYVPKLLEYRLHVFCGEVILIQQKRKKRDTGVEGDLALIRNHANGWVFAVEDVNFPTPEIKEDARQTAIRAVQCLGLDFGAVDLVLAKKTNSPIVLEVNTAPGIESPTLLEAYHRAITNLAN